MATTTQRHRFPLVARLFSLPSMAWILAATAFINRMGAMAKLFMAIYLRESLHLPLPTIGLLLAGYGAGTLVGAYGLGVLSDHVSPRRLAVACLCASGLGLLLLAQTSSVAWLAAFLFVGGVADAGYRPVVQRLIMEACEPAERPRAQSLLRVAINLGFAVGGFFGGMLAGWDYRYVFWADAATSFAAAAWLAYALARIAPPVDAAATAKSTPSLDTPGASPYRDRVFLCLLLAALPLGMMYDQINGLYGAYLREHHGLSPAWVGWQHGINGLLVALCQLPLTAWSQRYGVRGPVIWGCALMVAGLGMLPWVSGLAGVLASTVIWTVGEMLWMPTLGVIIMHRAEGRRSGHYFGMQSAMWSTSTLLAPLVGSRLYAAWGGDALWYAVLLAGIPATAVLAWAVGRIEQEARVV